MHARAGRGEVNAAARIAGVRQPSPVALPALRLFRSVPRDFIAHAVTDSGCAPLIAPGEVAIVTDQRQLIPEAGGWYLVEHSDGASSKGREHRIRSINLIYSKHGAGKEDWWVKRPAQRQRGVFEMSDGPYDIGHLCDKILGLVVGIYAPHRVDEDPTDREQWEMLRDDPWPYPAASLPLVGYRRAAK